MEKQTKILLGVGAVIAAYLILKPKKATAQTGVVTSNTKVCPEGQQLVDIPCLVAPCPSMCMPISIPETEEEYQIRLNKEIEKLKLAAFKNRDCATPMAIGYSSYFDEALGRCVTKYTKPTEQALIMAQLGDLTNWA